jgi:hypothetical protein
MAARYLNTDLDLEGGPDLQALADAFSRDADNGMFALHLMDLGGHWRAIFELNDCKPTEDTPAETIAKMLDVIEGLDAPHLAIWQSCTKRRFNIGYQSGRSPHSVTPVLANTLLLRIVAAGADVAVTLYGYSEHAEEFRGDKP